MLSLVAVVLQQLKSRHRIAPSCQSDSDIKHSDLAPEEISTPQQPSPLLFHDSFPYQTYDHFVATTTLAPKNLR